MASAERKTGDRKGAKRRTSTPRARDLRRLPQEAYTDQADTNAVIHVGWGRLLFGNTFENNEALVEAMSLEQTDERDIAIYVEDPHVAISVGPQDVFLDPSHTYRLWLSTYRPVHRQARGFYIRGLTSKEDAEAVNRIYSRNKMVTVPMEFLLKNRSSRRLTYLVAVDEATEQVIGTVTGVDHYRAFNDPERGSSLWCLAVDPQAQRPGVGEALVRQLSEHYQARGRTFMDLSVMHDNDGAIRLYEALGFQRIQTFTLKHKNEVNEKLYAASMPEKRLNPYAQIIINEARRRGIGVEIEDEEMNLFVLSFGGTRIACRESLSDLTSSVAMTRCDDKGLTRRLLLAQDIKVPDQIVAEDADTNRAFLDKYASVVVKPSRGEQGRGITVGVEDLATLERAIDSAKKYDSTVLIEQFCEGHDLRIIVIDYKVVAAAVRQPAAISGDGHTSIEDLIRKQSRRRAASTGGESRIPMDQETERCVRSAGYEMDSVLPEGTYLEVRKTANLHTGGTIHDVTARLHPRLVDAATRAARALKIPVVGFDFLVPKVDEPDYVIIEANERPGLANHEPQPTAERFIDLLFPQTTRGWGG